MEERKKEREANGYKPIRNEDIDKLKNILKHQYAYCDEKLGEKYTCDHIIPLSKGGVNNVSNITLCCSKCNADKANKDIHEFYEWKVKNRLPIRILLITGKDIIRSF